MVFGHLTFEKISCRFRSFIISKMMFLLFTRHHHLIAVEALKLIEMITRVKHIPSGAVYENRKEAKLIMGHSNYNKAIRNGQMLFVDTYDLKEVVFN